MILLFFEKKNGKGVKLSIPLDIMHRMNIGFVQVSRHFAESAEEQSMIFECPFEVTPCVGKPCCFQFLISQTFFKVKKQSKMKNTLICRL